MFKTVLLLILAMFSIQFGASVAKSAFPVIGAAGITTLRLFFATLFLWMIWRPWKKSVRPEQFKNLLVYGVALGFMNLLFYFALERIPLGIAVALEFTGPLGVAVFNSQRKLDYLWAVLAGIGIYLLLPISGSSLDWLGIFFALGAGFCWALYILYGQKAGKEMHGGLATTWGMTFAFAVVLPFGFFISGQKLVNPAILPLGMAVAILSSALPYSLEMISLKRMPPRTFGVLMSLEPALASVVGFVFLKEELSGLQLAAILCVIVSSLGSVISGAQTTAAV